MKSYQVRKILYFRDIFLPHKNCYFSYLTRKFKTSPEYENIFVDAMKKITKNITVKKIFVMIE